MRPGLGFSETDGSVRSLCTDGEMTLLLARVETDTIRLVGRRRSDTMIRHLHTTVKSFIELLAACMVQLGTYTLITPAHTNP